MTHFKRIFIAGIIQGSLTGKDIHCQDYRAEIKAVLQEYFPQAEILCPIEQNPNSMDYNNQDARRTFFDLINQVKRVDLLIAYLPQASMGTAIEMWESHRHGTPVWSITPLKGNWVVKYLSQNVFGSVKELREFLVSALANGKEVRAEDAATLTPRISRR